jgi:membrane protein CcdC involved in cytochrome C biogenesis
MKEIKKILKFPFFMATAAMFVLPIATRQNTKILRFGRNLASK